MLVYGPNGINIDPGSDYFDTTADGIPLYSFSRHLLEVRNDSDADIVLDGMSLVPQSGVLDFEWSIIDPDETVPTPFNPTNVTLAPGESQRFDVYFYPVEMGHRVADMTITYGGGETYEFTITGRARDNGVFFDHGEATVEKILGDPAQDGVMGGAVGDGAGNVFFTGNVNGWHDTFSEDISVSKMTSTGSLAWTMTWNESYEQLSPDPGQNGESGGSAESVAYGADGYLYVVGRRSQSASNSVFQTLLLKIDPTAGTVVWAKGWTPEAASVPAVASDSSEGYAVDASISGRVLVTGVAETGVSLLAFSTTDGSMIFQKSFDVAATYVDRGYTIAADGSGNAYIGGLTNGRGLLVRFTGVDGSSPTLDWAKKFDMGVGSNINSIDLDASGNAYLSLDRRGARTYFSAARVNTDGAVAWAKTWDEPNSGDNNNTYVVRVDGTDVYVGGRIAFTPFDTQFGEGFLMKLATADGAYDWGTMYYTGKGAEEMTEHRVKGIVFNGGDLQLGLQSYTNGLDFDHYWGFWYNATDSGTADPPGDGAARLSSYSPNVTDVTGDVVLSDIPNGTSHDLATTAWKAPPTAVTWEDLRDREGGGYDGDLVIMGIDMY